MQKKNVMNVLVLGFPLDRYAELEFALEAELKPRKVGFNLDFVQTREAAIMKASSADIIAANVDKCGDFFVELFKRGYEGNIVPMSSCRSQMSKSVAVPGKKGVMPTTFRGTAEEILKHMKVTPTAQRPQGEAVLAA